MVPEPDELLCRVCLKQDELMVDVYEHVEEQQTDLCTLLESCGGIKVSCKQTRFLKRLKVVLKCSCR